ncbi:hypothetical protein [Bacteroides helcogenes]|uniref:Uncharacterized protein n=1 Tax=Bacteroides helcogenes (strain ATCC 35417 / DSM 20613 / JCM 6297 / CCUG 15421 / P 36-108) TaxID=693979 RepID=E6SNV8_BACT6|nr:hypothetical protein [Bacteroides helcogenes]ADV42776.1 hypothetical protein Bache_0754 [Bacteroides helcogenes P 36-108]MDY5239608.1 hypothetical protein [Bacteroides helcogenes]
MNRLAAYFHQRDWKQIAAYSVSFLLFGMLLDFLLGLNDTFSIRKITAGIIGSFLFGLLVAPGKKK